MSIDLTGTENNDYDAWLEFFRKIPKNQLLADINELADVLPGDGYAAAMRWLEIYEKPSKMDKLYKGRLDREHEQDIMEVAVGDDDEAFYVALIQQNTQQLQSSSVSQQEVARLTSNINIFRKELRLIRSRNVKKGTTLEKVLTAAQTSPKPARKPRKATNASPRKPKAKN